MSKSGLAVAQNLYVLQFQLEDFLQSDLSEPEARKEAQQSLKTFEKLLEDLDPAYLGDDEIIATLHSIQKKVAEKIAKYSKKK